LSDVSVDDLKENEYKVKFYLNQIDYEIPDDFSIKIKATSCTDESSFEYSLDVNNQTCVATLPIDQYEISIIEQTSKYYKAVIDEDKKILDLKELSDTKEREEHEEHKARKTAFGINVELSTDDLGENEGKVRIHLEQLDYEIPDDFSVKVRFTSYYNGSYTDYVLDKNNSILIVTMPTDKYNVSVVEHTGKSKIDLSSELVKFYNQKNDYEIEVLTNMFTTNGQVQDNTEQIEQTSRRDNRKTTIIRMNIICIILLIGTGIYFLYKKKMS
jgi:hypothetical protein